MPQRTSQYVENNFSAGLKTEYTGLNFPENAAIDCNNTVFTITGEVTRRLGFNIDQGAFNQGLGTGFASSSYRWNNVGGDGQTQIMVVQNASNLWFYQTSNATLTAPTSRTILSANVNISSFLPVGSPNISLVATTECQFTDGNGYLFVFHPYLEPFYCTFNAGSIVASQITMQIRDFAGIFESEPAVNYRPLTLSAEHQYNLQNQGWNAYPSWQAVSTTLQSITGTGTGSFTFSVSSGLAVINSEAVQATAPSQYRGEPFVLNGNVTSYSGTALVIDSTSAGVPYNDSIVGNWTIHPINANLITTWFTAIGNYPSNADVWWTYNILENGLEVFPTSTSTPSLVTSVSNKVVPNSPSPTGSYIMSVFTQNKTFASGVANLTTVFTNKRPSTGAFFQGRVWYAGVDDSFQATGDAQYTTWTENIYFSQVITTSSSQSQFGMCYQTNDPTDENFFDELPTDGGVINIQGSGAIYKLFPIQNGLLVFASQGIWFITGSQGIGFSATDYTVTKISGVQSISGTSFVNLQGFPVFWNEEGIYAVRPSTQGGGLSVENIVLGTIATFYGNIPNSSKQYVRGDYNPVTYIMQWCYRSTVETGTVNRYEFDTVLCYLVPKQCFYVYTISQFPAENVFINDVKYVNYPNGISSPDSTFLYLTSTASGFTFSAERDVNYLEWQGFGANTTFVSSFTTGYKLHGKAISKWQPLYLYMFSGNVANTSYSLQGVWDYSISGNSGKISTRQQIVNTASTTNFSSVYRRHKIRGRGLVLQIEITSIGVLPFDFYGWSMVDQVNMSI